MTLPAKIAEHFEHQAKACDALGSPFTARLCRLLIDIVDNSTTTGRRLSAWPENPRGDALALRLCGSLHRLVLAGVADQLRAVYPPYESTDAGLIFALGEAISRHDCLLHDWLDSPPQTNEIARAAMLLPGFLAIARETRLPLSVCEIGASAGLNLHFDRFGYAYGEARWGDAASPVQLSPKIRGVPPPLDGTLCIPLRAGCDIAPVDISTEAGRLWLRSFVWADQPTRLDRLDGALELAARVPANVLRADAAAFVREQLVARPNDKAFVVFHSIMWQYLPRETKEAVLLALNEAGHRSSPDAPIFRLRMEPCDPKDDFCTLSLTSWPGGETRQLAMCDFHGRWIEWTD